MLGDLVVVIHFLFILFVVTGPPLVIVWSKLALVHAPAAAWAVMVIGFGWPCPLTDLEFRLRGVDGGAGFIDRYLMPLIDPPGLTRELQVTLALLLLVYWLSCYWLAFKRHKRLVAGKRLDD